MRTKPHPDPNCDYLELAKIGMVGELDKVAELLKKDKFSGKPLDLSALVKEAGDLVWPMYSPAPNEGSGTMQQMPAPGRKAVIWLIDHLR
jgi:hypothetical protein